MNITYRLWRPQPDPAYCSTRRAAFRSATYSRPSVAPWTSHVFAASDTSGRVDELGRQRKHPRGDFFLAKASRMSNTRTPALLSVRQQA